MSIVGITFCLCLCFSDIVGFFLFVVGSPFLSVPLLFFTRIVMSIYSFFFFLSCWNAVLDFPF